MSAGKHFSIGNHWLGADDILALDRHFDPRLGEPCLTVRTMRLWIFWSLMGWLGRLRICI